MTILFGPQNREVASVMADLGLTADLVQCQVSVFTDWTQEQAQKFLSALGSAPVEPGEDGKGSYLTAALDGGRVVVFYPKPACASCKGAAA